MDQETASNPIETSLNGIGFTEDANAVETETPTSVATETEEPETPETAEETVESEETPAEGETEEVSETEEPAEAAEEEEEPHGYDAMLPNRQLKNYPEELYALAAKKFGVDPNLISNQSIRDLLKGKIDADIDNRSLREQLDAYGDQDVEETEEQEEVEEPTEGQVVTPEVQLQAISRFLREGPDGQSPIITPEGSKVFSEATLDAYTDLQNAIDSGDAGKIQQAQQKFTETQAKFVTLMFANVLPALLPRMLQNLPEQLWDGVVGAKLEDRETMKDNHRSARDLLAKDPRYADISSLIKSKAIYNFVRENPEVLDKEYRDVNGRPIRDPVKLAVAQYKAVIHAIRGQQYRPPQDLVKKGMAAGERHAREMADRKAASKGISAARTRGILGNTKGDRYEPGNWADRMKRAAQDSDPLGTFLKNSQT